MANWLNDANDWLNNGLADAASFVGWDGYKNWLDESRKAAQEQQRQQQLRNEHPSFFQQWLNNGDNQFLGEQAVKGLGWVDHHVRSLPVVGDTAGFLIDLPNRTFDTIGQVAANAGREEDDLKAFGQLLNTDSWNRAWDSWGKAGHLTLGTIVAARALGNDPRVYQLNPFDAQDAQQLQKLANGTQYGSLMAGFVDVAAGFVSPIPGGGVLKAAKASKTIEAGHLEEMANILDNGLTTPGGLTPKSNAAYAAQRAKDTARKYLQPEKPVSSQSMVDQLLRGVQGTDGILDPVKMQDKLRPWLEHAPESTVMQLADLFTEANYLPDAKIRTHAKANMILAGMGSQAAKLELIKYAPELAASLEQRTSAIFHVGLYNEMLTRYLQDGDFRINSVLDAHFDLPGKQAQRQAVRDELMQAMATEVRAKADRVSLKLNAPLTRSEINAQADLANQLQNRLDDLRTGARNEPPEGIGYYQNASEQAWMLLRDMEQRYAAQDPAFVAMHDQAMAGANAEVAAATQLKNDLTLSKAAADAEYQNAVAARYDKNIELSMERLNTVLTEMWDLKQVEGGFTGTAAPTMLAHMKTQYRNAVGSTYLHRSGLLKNSPVAIRAIGSSLAAIGTPHARGGLNIAEPDRGLKEMQASLRRAKGRDGSSLFTGEEIAQYGREFVQTIGEDRLKVVDKAHRDMLNRIGFSFHLNKDQAYSRTQLAINAYDEGRKHLSNALEKAGESKVVLVEGMEDVPHAFYGPALKSHLSDTVRWIDPAVYLRALRRKETTLADRRARAIADAWDALDTGGMIWKHAALMRPGLGVRAMLDTGLRATAQIGAATQLVQAINGTLKLLSKADRTALTRFGVLHGDVANVAARTMGSRPFAVDLGGGMKAPTAAYKDGLDMQQLRMQMSKGASVSDSILRSNNRLYSFIRENTSSWKWYNEDDEFWPLAWQRSAEAIAKSPTGRHLLDDLAEPPRNMTVEQYTADLFKDPKVRDEYARMGATADLTREEWVQELIVETHALFPDTRAVDMIRSGKVSEAKVKQLFPKHERFDIPGWQSVLSKEGPRHRIEQGMNHFYNAVLDAPDFWLARHPVYVTQYQRTILKEAKQLRDQLAGGEHINGAQFRVLENRAKSRALAEVRKTFYDTTRHTLLGEHLTRIMPFFRPWEDAMMAWGRLILDDPRRFTKLSGAWNAPDNAQASVESFMGQPLLVDGEGRPIDRQGFATNEDGSKVKSDSGVYIAVPWKQNGVQMRIRKEALNSIAQGNVWWMPGLGPQAIVPATWAIGQLQKHNPQAAADLANSKDPVVDFLLRNMYLDGEVPPTDMASILWSVVPAGWKNAINDTAGVSGAQATVWSFNKAYLDAQKKGLPFDPQKALKQAQAQARTAMIVRLISQTGFGMSGRAVVDGQYYVDQMHIMDALPQSELEKLGYPNSMAMFADKFPDAADLDWRFGVNETGITASVNAQRSAAKERKLIDANPDLGWFIVGGDNIAQGRPGDEFSMSVYNQQRSVGYGLQDAKRNRPNEGQAVSDALTAMGWKEWHKFTLGLDEYARRNNLPDTFKSFVKQRARDQLGARYPTWLKDYTTRNDTLVNFVARADAISNNPAVRDRPDMQMYREYRAYRQEVLKAFDIKSLTGTSVPYVLARYKLRQYGEQLAAQNIGFSQVWDRQLSAEAEAKDTDATAIQEFQNAGS